jgi:hypothetical protein
LLQKLQNKITLKIDYTGHSSPEQNGYQNMILSGGETVLTRKENIVTYKEIVLQKMLPENIAQYCTIVLHTVT